MTRKEDLERSIRDSYAIIRTYEEQIRTSNYPEEKQRAQGKIEEQWNLIQGYLDEYARLMPELPPDIAEIAAHFKPAAQANVFISYRRNADPDEPLMIEIRRALGQAGHRVFVDRDLPIGVEWAVALEGQIQACDVVIVLLSDTSVHSEMLVKEVQCAHENHQQTGRSRLLPVRLAYRQPFQYPLNVYLDPLNWGWWEQESDTPRLVQELNRAISGSELTIAPDAQARFLQVSRTDDLVSPSASAQPRLELPEGTMDPESKFYIERAGDRVGMETIERQGVTITIKGPRQMGKSSLLIRLMNKAASLGKRTAFLDFQLFEKPVLGSADAFFAQFCRWLTDELEMDDRVDEHWQIPLGNSQRCTRYLSRYLLKELDAPLLLAMDEVDAIFDTIFRTDFFGMLRSWHNQRRAGSIWRRLDLALVTSTEPYQLIADLNQSPFNVGEVIELEDLTGEQVDDLNRRHGSPLASDQVQRLIALLHGHPYLTRRALYLVASRRMSTQELFDRAGDENGPFGDHLRYHLFRLHNNDKLIKQLLCIIQQQTCADEHDFFRLRGAGLVRREGQRVVPRCPLYADYFKEWLHGH